MTNPMTYTALGHYHLNDLGENMGQIRMVDENSVEQDYLAWGMSWDPARPSYPLPPVGGRWYTTPDLREAPYNVPADAKAVKIWIKAKVKTRPNAPHDTISAIQVAVAGDQPSSNEVAHAHCTALAGELSPGEEITHAQFIAKLKPDGTLGIFAHPSIYSWVPDGQGGFTKDIPGNGQSWVVALLAGYYR